MKILILTLRFQPNTTDTTNITKNVEYFVFNIYGFSTRV